MGVDNSMGLVCCFKLDRKICSRAGGQDSDEEYDENTDVISQVMSQEGMTSTFHRSTFQRQASGHTLHDDDEKEEMEHDVQARIARANSFVVSSSDLGAWQHPTSSFRRNWNIFLFLGVCYNLAVIPIRIAFLNSGRMFEFREHV